MSVGTAAATALIALPALAGALLADPAAPGPDAPPAGHSTFEEVFADGVPFPFAALLARLRAVAGEANVTTALVPLGRSLQRFAAHPDYFASPRLVVAVTGDRAAGPEAPRLADRLFIGFQPAAEAIEVIGYNEEAGRFEFHEIAGYGADRPRGVGRAERRVCVTCHQGHGPIFARPLWGETNANPAVAERLAPIGAKFEGAPVRQSVDAVAAFDAATDRAARIALANRLWDAGCADPACRAALLGAALRYGLNGARPGWGSGSGPAAAAFAARAAVLWPEGLMTPSPDLPNRDPTMLLDRRAPEQAIESAGELNPETPHAPVTIWRAGPDAFDAAARAVADMLAPGDFGWIDGLLRAVPPAGEWTFELDCELGAVETPVGSELRFQCAGGALRGFVLRRGGRLAGRIETLTIGDQAPLNHLAGRAMDSGGGLAFTLAESATGLAARLADGRRVAGLTIAPSPRGGTAAVNIVDDVSPLAAALARAAEDGAPALASGPFRRRAVLAMIREILGGADG